MIGIEKRTKKENTARHWIGREAVWDNTSWCVCVLLLFGRAKKKDANSEWIEEGGGQKNEQNRPHSNRYHRENRTRERERDKKYSKKPINSLKSGGSPFHDAHYIFEHLDISVCWLPI